MRKTLCDICGRDADYMGISPRKYKVKIGVVFPSHTRYFDICNECRRKILNMLQKEETDENGKECDT